MLQTPSGGLEGVNVFVSKRLSEFWQRLRLPATELDAHPRLEPGEHVSYTHMYTCSGKHTTRNTIPHKSAFDSL